MFTKSQMAASFLGKFLILLSIFSIISKAHLQFEEDGFISVTISEKGIDFVKDLLIGKAVSSLTPLELPPIERTLRIPLLGKVRIVLSSIVIYHIDVPSSNIELGDGEITITASRATANLSMDWKYTYKNWFGELSDNGKASVQVEDMEVGLTVSLEKQGGKLKLSLLESNCEVDDIDVTMDGGASWLYQGVVDAFSNHIEDAVQVAILKKLTSEVAKIDSLLGSLPTEIKVDDTSTLNVTFVTDPILSDSSIGFVINGLFVPTYKTLTFPFSNQVSRAFVPSNGPSKMIAISLHEDVFNSLSSVYFNARLMWWKVDKIPHQSLLNTSDWRDVVPQLYEEFPNEGMALNVSVTAPPFVHILNGQMKATVYADVTVDVLGNVQVTPVACVSLVMSASGSTEISGNNLTATIKLDNFSLSAKWSNVGDLQIEVIEPVISEVLNEVLLPTLNSRLMSGFPLPLIHGFTLKNAEIDYLDSMITVSSDVAFADDYQLPNDISINNIFSFRSLM